MLAGPRLTAVAARGRGQPGHVPRLERAVPRWTKWAKMRKERIVFVGACASLNSGAVTDSGVTRGGGVSRVTPSRG